MICPLEACYFISTDFSQPEDDTDAEAGKSKYRLCTECGKSGKTKLQNIKSQTQ